MIDYYLERECQLVLASKIPINATEDRLNNNHFFVSVRLDLY